jgi:hypothetical protein
VADIDYDRHETKKQWLRIFLNFRLRWLEMKQNDSQEMTVNTPNKGGLPSTVKESKVTRGP